MPSPKDGSAGTLVSPTAPTAAEEADSANPGEMEALKQQQRETSTGKYGSKPVKPFKKAGSSGGGGSSTAGSSGGGAGAQEQQDPPKNAWIEVKLVDEEGKPVAGEVYRVTVPDGSVWESTTDDQGLGRVDGIDPGNCQVTFPNLDESAWDAK